jgi:hypothetical protein
MSEFRIEVVGSRNFKKHKMPSAAEVEEKLERLWDICWDREPDWHPLGEFKFRERIHSDPIFRVRDFARGREDGIGGLDLLGTYHRSDSLVTIYIDSCFKAARRYSVLLDDLVDVVLVHELAHLVTHRGFGVDDLSSRFMEHTAQCATYAYLKPSSGEALKAFELLSPHQPFIYRTWEGLKELPKTEMVIMSRPDEVQEVVKAFFQKVLHTLRPPDRGEIQDCVGYDS